MFDVTWQAAEINTSFSKESWKFGRWGSYLVAAETIASVAFELGWTLRGVGEDTCGPL